MNRYEVKIRTPKGNETSIKTVEAISKNSVSALISVSHLVGINSHHFTVSVRCVGEVAQ